MMYVCFLQILMNVTVIAVVMGLVSMYWALSLVSALLATPSTLKSNNVLVSANAASYNIIIYLLCSPHAAPNLYFPSCRYSYIPAYML